MPIMLRVTRERSWLRRSGCIVAWAGLVSTLRCVNTELDEGEVYAPCSQSVDVESSLRSVLAIDARLIEGTLRCSGVAIAPTLVATSLGCVYRPSQIGDSNPRAQPEPTLRYPSIEMDELCDPTHGWRPLENGSFEAEWGQAVAAEDIEIFVAGERERSVAVKEIFHSAAASRCSPGIALLDLAETLDVVPVPVRLDEVATPGDTVTLVGHCVAITMLERSRLETTVASVTLEQGTEYAPENSFVLAGGSLGTDIGGAVIANDTGALVGIVASGAGSQCGEQDASGATLATRTSAFGNLLVTAAANRGTALRAEPRGRGADLAPCAAP
jgi:hypothetical protein